MKNVVILHGYGETPKSFWLPYVKKELEERRYKVSVPKLPNANDPKLNEQLEYVLKNETFGEETVLIGHSSGCPLILAFLENISVKIKLAILVAGYARPLKLDPKGTKNIKENFDWIKIQKNCEKFVIINSYNDPWGADDKQGRAIFDHLKDESIMIVNAEGHMGSDRFNQPYEEFPFLLKLID